MPRGRPVPQEAKEVARNLAFTQGRGGRPFNNIPPVLPRAGRGEFYREDDVVLGHALGRGQYRVVCLFDVGGRVLNKYYSATHYGTGEDAGRRPDFIEFE